MMYKELEHKFGKITNLHVVKNEIKFDKVLPKGKKIAGSNRLKVSISLDQLSD